MSVDHNVIVEPSCVRWCVLHYSLKDRKFEQIVMTIAEIQGDYDLSKTSACGRYRIVVCNDVCFVTSCVVNGDITIVRLSGRPSHVGMTVDGVLMYIASESLYSVNVRSEDRTSYYHGDGYLSITTNCEYVVNSDLKLCRVCSIAGCSVTVTELSGSYLPDFLQMECYENIEHGTLGEEEAVLLWHGCKMLCVPVDDQGLGACNKKWLLYSHDTEVSVTLLDDRLMVLDSAGGEVNLTLP